MEKIVKEQQQKKKQEQGVVVGVEGEQQQKFSEQNPKKKSGEHVPRHSRQMFFHSFSHEGLPVLKQKPNRIDYSDTLAMKIEIQPHVQEVPNCFPQLNSGQSNAAGHEGWLISISRIVISKILLAKSESNSSLYISAFGDCIISPVTSSTIWDNQKFCWPDNLILRSIPMSRKCLKTQFITLMVYYRDGLRSDILVGQGVIQLVQPSVKCDLRIKGQLSGELECQLELNAATEPFGNESNLVRESLEFTAGTAMAVGRIFKNIVQTSKEKQREKTENDLIELEKLRRISIDQLESLLMLERTKTTEIEDDSVVQHVPVMEFFQENSDNNEKNHQTINENSSQYFGRRGTNGRRKLSTVSVHKITFIYLFQ
eukprot:c19190_g1_i3.p1 GENE.c19190_g1_i3~~c19190_g1_i3.p1  ORF type:complete len:383 (-),score=170.27 c19190_g1_i3:36-1145(-)